MGPNRLWDEAMTSIGWKEKPEDRGMRQQLRKMRGQDGAIQNFVQGLAKQGRDDPTEATMLHEEGAVSSSAVAEAIAQMVKEREEEQRLKDAEITVPRPVAAPTAPALTPEMLRVARVQKKKQEWDAAHQGTRLEGQYPSEVLNTP
jgi:hypothetical protein